MQPGARHSTQSKWMMSIAVTCIPFAAAVLSAQNLPAPQYTYDVVTIRPAAPGERRSLIGPGPQGGMKMQNMPAIRLMTFAWNVQEFQFTDVPEWARTMHFDVTFTPDREESGPAPGLSREQADGMFNRQRQRMQSVLRDRFGLVLRTDSRELPMYALTIAKGGPKLTQSAAQSGNGPRIMMGRGQMNVTGGSLTMLASSLSMLAGRHVSNETGLDGPFDFKLEWTPDASMRGPGGPPGMGPGPGPGPEPASGDPGVSLFTALTEQLGLKLEPRKGKVPVFVVEKIEKPSEN